MTLVNNVRRPLHEGMQLVHALWFDLALSGEAEVRCRVLRHWAPGARLHLVQDGFLLLLATPCQARCELLDGLPLCEQAGILSSAPLAPDERAATPPSCCWLVRAAQAQLVSLAAAPRIDPAAWLELDAIALQAPLQPPRAATGDHPALLAAVPVHDIFSGTLAPPSASRGDFLKQLDQARHGQRPAISGAGIGQAMAGMAGILARLFGGHAQATSSQAGGKHDRQPPSALGQRLAALASRLAILTRASSIIGWRQAAYLRKMMELLDKGDTAEALRHAIPLDSSSQAGRQAFGTPRPRSSLEISGPGRSRSVIGLGGELEDYLRTTYRRTFERLDREGKIDEATYVLAELLKQGGEAVDYLEQHGRLKQAAQLAETMELAPEIAVRLWCMAGNVERAVQLARIGQAFAAAVQLLEKRKSPQAPLMRLLWAEDLALRGQLAEAAQAIWPLPEQQGQALAWLLEGERAGGTLGLRSLLKKLVLLPASLADSEARVLQLLDDDSEHGVQQRLRLGTELLALSQHSPATKRVAAELMRPLLADRMAGRSEFDKKSLTRLLSLSDGAILQADLPSLSMAAITPPPGLTGRGEVLRMHLDERGLLAIHDARRLPDGHYLLALGEAGVVRIDRHGRQLAQFPVPATRLVMAAGGQRALALVQRDSKWRVSHIDLIARKVSDWIIEPLRFWADNHDGLVWNAVIDNRLVAIDTSKDQLAVCWQVADLPGRVIAFLEEQGTQTLLLETAHEIEQWRYQLPARRLMQRDSFPRPQHEVLALLPHHARDTPTLIRERREGPYSILEVHNGISVAPFKLASRATAGLIEVTQTAGLLLVRSYPDDGETLDCLVADNRTGKMLAQLSLAECESARVQVDDGHILLFDLAGRLIDVCCEDSAVHVLILG